MTFLYIELPSLPMLAAAVGILFGAAVFALGTWMRSHDKH